MTSCPTCGAQTIAQATSCAACGTTISNTLPGRRLSAIYAHVPHPHIAKRKQHAPKPAPAQTKSPGLVTRLNATIAVKITDAVGTMWCAYAFAALALVSLPEAIKAGTPALIAWIAQTFLQLVLLSIIIVGQKVASESTDKRALDTYNDAEAVLHESIQIQQHLLAQDAFLQRLIDVLVDGRPSTDSAASGTPAADRPAPPTG